VRVFSGGVNERPISHLASDFTPPCETQFRAFQWRPYKSDPYFTKHFGQDAPSYPFPPVRSSRAASAGRTNFFVSGYGTKNFLTSFLPKVTIPWFSYVRVAGWLVEERQWRAFPTQARRMTFAMVSEHILFVFDPHVQKLARGNFQAFLGWGPPKTILKTIG